MVFPVVMNGCESWTVKKAKHQRIDASELFLQAEVGRGGGVGGRGLRREQISQDGVFGLSRPMFCK